MRKGIVQGDCSMGSVGFLFVLFVLKLVTLAGALAQTVGFVGLFAFEALDPYKWQLLIGGTLVIIASEGTAYLLAKRMSRND